MIGQSNEATDWNYVHPAVLRENREVYLPPWKIEFELNEQMQKGKAIFTLAIASPAYGAGLEIMVNGIEVFDASLAPYDGAALHNAISGYYREETMTFDTALLRHGTNSITLLQTGTYEHASIMYDCLRLEVRETSE